VTSLPRHKYLTGDYLRAGVYVLFSHLTLAEAVSYIFSHIQRSSSQFAENGHMLVRGGAFELVDSLYFRRLAGPERRQLPGVCSKSHIATVPPRDAPISPRVYLCQPIHLTQRCEETPPPSTESSLSSSNPTIKFEPQSLLRPDPSGWPDRRALTTPERRPCSRPL